MIVIALILFISITSRATFPSTTANDFKSSKENKLSQSILKKVDLQIQEKRVTSETAPATFPGNNLNVIGASEPSVPFDVQPVNFPAISTVYSFENQKSTRNDVTKRANEENITLSSLSDDVTINYKGNYFHSSLQNSPLVWDDCSETSFKDNYLNILRTQHNKKVEVYNHILSFSTHKTTTTDNLNKKDITIKPESSTMPISWLKKYNQLKTANSEKKGSINSDSGLLRKITQTTSTNRPLISLNTLKVEPITREIIFVEPTLSSNLSSGEIVTENVVKAGYTEDWFDAKDKTKIRFGELPRTDTYLTPTLKLEEGFYPFSFMSKFFSLIYPFDFPVELVKDIVWGKISFPYSFLQNIKLESTFLVFVVIFVCVALIIPSYLMILCILSLASRPTDDNNLETGALFQDEERSDCSGGVLVVTTLLIVLICCTLIAGMAITNEQARYAAEQARNVVSCACADIASWLTTAARELIQVIASPIDLVMNAYEEDLNNVDTLLGEPVQQAIASESGIDLVIDSLADIVSESNELSSKIALLRELGLKGEELAASASNKINDLANQMDNLKKYCTAKDAPLCDTINTNSLEIRMKFNLILQEQQLLKLRRLGVDDLTHAISTAQEEFQSIPRHVAEQTNTTRKNILKDIENQKEIIHSSSKIFNDIVRHLTSGLHSVARKLDIGLSRALVFDFWRWIIMLVCIVAFAFVMALVLTSLLCGCNAKNHAKRTLQISSVWLCFVSLILWGIVSTVFLIAGHAEIFVCQALWDSPQYTTLSALLDRPSPFLQEKEGIFDELFRDLDNVTIDISIRNIIRECEIDEPAYTVFQLEKVLDVNKQTSYFEWKDLQNDLKRLSSTINVAILKSVSVSFIKILNEMLQVTNVNLPKYRLSYNVPVVGKDLPSLVDQLENIAVQVSDLTTAGRLETLATRIQRLHATSIKPLEEMRADLVFKLTELELQMLPFRKKINISLSHIHTAQYYINNQGDIIAHKKVSVYVSRLVSHLAGWRAHALEGAARRAARCRPLHRVYTAGRALLCTRYLSSMHGWWLCGVILGLFWCTALIPLIVKLWRYYDKKLQVQDSISLSNLNPAPPAPPPRNDNW